MTETSKTVRVPPQNLCTKVDGYLIHSHDKSQPMTPCTLISRPRADQYIPG